MEISNKKERSINYQYIPSIIEAVKQNSYEKYAAYEKRSYFGLDTYTTENLQGTIDNCSKAIEINSNDISACYIRGYLMLSTGKYEAAIPDFDKVLRQNPKDYVYFSRGIARFEINDYGGAISDLNMAIKKNLKDHYVYYIRGLAKLGNEDYRGAISDFKETKDIIEVQNDVFKKRGISKFKLGDYEEAIADFTLAIDNGTADMSSYYNRGLAKFEVKDFSSAISDLDHVLYSYNKSPNLKYVYYFMGLAKIKLRQRSGGCSDLSKAGELGLPEAYEAIKKYCQ